MPVDPRVRQQRLREDYDRMRRLEARSNGAISIQAFDPPAPIRYVVTYRLKSVFLERSGARRTTNPETHQVQFVLPEHYPATLTRNDVKFLTRPIFHPNVWESGHVCIADYSPSETLAEFVKRIGRMIQFVPGYANADSAANGDAVDWYRQNERTFPVDTTRLPELDDDGAAPSFQAGRVVRRSSPSTFTPGTVVRR